MPLYLLYHVIVYLSSVFIYLSHFIGVVRKMVQKQRTTLNSVKTLVLYIVVCGMEVGGNTITPTSRPPPPHSTEYGRHAVACSDRAQLSWYALRRTVRGDTPTTQPLTESLSSCSLSSTQPIPRGGSIVAEYSPIAQATKYLFSKTFSPPHPLKVSLE